MMRGRIWKFYSLMVLLVFVVLLATASNLVLPELGSSCGRLVHAGLDDSALTLNQVRLDIPSGITWQEIDLAYHLLPDEALHFIMSRQGDDFLVLRFSRINGLEHALLTFKGGMLQDKQPLAANVILPTEGELNLARHENGVTAKISGSLVLALNLPTEEGTFEIAMFPPSCVGLLDRIRLKRVLLSSGEELPPRSVLKIFKSVYFLFFLSVMLAIPLVVLTGIDAERLFPYHATRNPRQVLVFMSCLIIAVTLLCFIPKISSLGYLTMARRYIFRSFVGIVVVWSILFMVVRDRFLSRYRNLYEIFLLKTPFLPAIYFITTLLVFFLMVWGFFHFFMKHDHKDQPHPESQNAPIKVICYGGSSTYGYPFSDEWPFTYPSVLEDRLKKSFHPRTVVWNHGENAATIKIIENRLVQEAPIINPTLVVISSITNNTRNRPEYLKEHLKNILRLAASKGYGLFLIKEPEYCVVYDDLEKYGVKIYYDTLELVGSSKGVVVIDPIPEFKAHRDGFLFIDNACHLTKYGHALLSGIIEKSILENYHHPEGSLPSSSSVAPPRSSKFYR